MILKTMGVPISDLQDFLKLQMQQNSEKIA
jgi:hypothetical protein